MPNQINNYQCPSCTGPLHYVGASGKLECDYCGNKYDVAEIEALYAQKEKEAKEAYAKAEAKAKAEAEAKAAAEAKAEAASEAGIPADDPSLEENSGWNADSLNSEWGDDAEKMRAYNCPSCGAQLICDETTAATSCPYCGNPTVIPGKFDGTLKPDYVIPFKLDREHAKKALKEHYKGKRLLPDAFSEENHIDEIKGVYVPFWLFDGDVDANVSFSASKTESYRSGDYRVTKTHHYNVVRSGNVAFKKIPVDASSKMPDEYMDSIEPFDYGDMVDFSTAYLPGYLADKYDMGAKDCTSRVDERAANSAVIAMRNDVTGYDACSIDQKNVEIHRGDVHYALLPVYMLSTRWKDQNYLFAMNGQTGKMIGNLPISMAKFWAWFAGISIPVTLAVGSLIRFFG